MEVPDFKVEWYAWDTSRKTVYMCRRKRRTEGEADITTKD